mmetsp:Transcript_14938/g.41579  ORF Transcript_14938/g.41579 Transcript_14938/m.41579 type:complete len:680 (-) Transcript_14938:540-2579(-)
MGPREIPSLSVLCLRSIGHTKCKADDTFAPTKDGKPSTASRLLRSFHNRPVLGNGETVAEYLERSQEAIQNFRDGTEHADEKTESNIEVPSIEQIPMKRTPAIGAGSGRRKQANDIDLNHPWIAAYQSVIASSPEDSSDPNSQAQQDDDPIPTNPQEQTLVAANGSCALDLLQSYVDALVELGRMDDNRLGLRFFAEFKTNIELQYLASKGSLKDAAQAPAAQATATTAASSEPVSVPPTTVIDAPIPKKKKRKRSGGTSAATAAKKKREAEAKAKAEAQRQAAILAALPKSKGSLSLHNCEMLRETTNNLLTSRVLEHIHTLDLTGLQTLTDDILWQLLQSAGLQLKRLSVKNCRRLTEAAVHHLCASSPNLEALDLGGDYNISPRTVIDALAVQTIRRGRGVYTTQALPHLVELHASGIGPKGGWTDDLLPELFALRGWRALSVGFSPYLTFAGWKAALLSVEQRHEEATEVAPKEGAAAVPRARNNMCQTLVSLGIAFCEQQLVDNAWLGLMGRHLPNLRALDVRGNHHLNSITSWYDGRATILSSSSSSSGDTGDRRVRPKQSLVVLARYCGISQNAIEETKRIYPLAAGGDQALTVVTESGGIGWGILRQERDCDASATPLKHYQRRLAAAKIRAKQQTPKRKGEALSTPAPSTPSKVVVIPTEEDGGDVGTSA